MHKKIRTNQLVEEAISEDGLRQDLSKWSQVRGLNLGLLVHLWIRLTGLQLEVLHTFMFYFNAKYMLLIVICNYRIMANEIWRCVL